MRDEIHRLRAANLALQEEVQGLKQCQATAPGPQDDEEDSNLVGEDALRKRLKRMCERKKNGLLV